MPRFSHRRTFFWLYAVVVIAVASWCGFHAPTSMAQSQTQNRAQSIVEDVDAASFPNSERTLTDELPRHLPIRIKVKNLHKQKWARDLEVEVTNTSDKPIYFLKLVVLLPEALSSGGMQLGFPLYYGRMGLIDITAPLQPDDVPLQPGEKYVFKIPANQVRNFEKRLSVGNLRNASIKKVRLVFDFLNFGDGTGFSNSGGDYQDVKKRQAVVNSCVGNDKFDFLLKRPLNALLFKSNSLVPVTFSPALFSFAEFSDLRTNISAVDVCCPGTSCSQLKRVEYSCYCGRIDSAPTTACGDPAGQCGTQEPYQISCEDDYGNEVFCNGLYLLPCADPCDRDRDGYRARSCGGDDCNDTPGYGEDIHPGPFAFEKCGNNEDDDCDGEFDEGCTIVGGGCFEPEPWCTKQTVRNEPQPTIIKANYTRATRSSTGSSTATLQRCTCDHSPILIDVLGDGFALTDAANGVRFDFNGDGTTEGRLSWTRANSDDAWLVLDRNGNNLIDSSLEMFGNYTAQPDADERHGFLALAEYDTQPNGGNNDGALTSRDTVFAQLRLWQDRNHNGISEANELFALPALDVVSIDLDYKESKRTDEYGNRFRYRTKVKDAKGAKVGRWAWDVFLTTTR